ncbi:MAG: squalene/phytoene synthase family protein [Alphaproteobacteria bacterium]
MSAPALSPAATLVRRLDPDLFHAALFAPEPARERLMVLYAFDIEVSRVAARTTEPLIAAMRLQWWRDLVAGETASGHELAEPLRQLLSASALPADDLERLIEAREMELDGPMDQHRFGDWLDARFGALTRLAVHLLAGGNPAARRAAGAVGHANGVAFALRTAAAMAAEANTFLLPGLAPEDRAALARGRTTGHARVIAHGLASQAQIRLAISRAERRAVPKAATPALLPVWRAERVLRRARRLDLDLQRDLAGQGSRGMALAWRALRGRW